MSFVPSIVHTSGEYLLLPDTSAVLAPGFINRDSALVNLQGELRIQVLKPVTIKSIQFKFESQTSFADHNDSLAHYILYSRVNDLSLESSFLDSGEHIFPYSIPVPTWLPPSIQTAHGHVSHQIHVSIRKSGLRMVKSQTSQLRQSITVYRTPQLQHDASFVKRWTGERTDRKLAWAVSSPTFASIGGCINLSIRMYSQTLANVIKCCTANLIQQETHTTRPDRNTWGLIMDDQPDLLMTLGDFGSVDATTTEKAFVFYPSTNLQKRILGSPVTAKFPPPPATHSIIAPQARRTVYRLNITIPLHPSKSIYPSHSSLLITIVHKVSLTFRMVGAKDLLITLPILILPEILGLKMGISHLSPPPYDEAVVVEDSTDTEAWLEESLPQYEPQQSVDVVG
ncbi:hypothetical protein NEOLI_002090 [Neolecta irregularis DAH-3]|uniref:Arrestin-like N-terminal domain-containing protein n=1 Tax=Neolecta irregularis (strain DAH-3) TaxID=1198029 RepID=A0A1U7LN10_NEOID|nr:hypothetical protein NEOLI_002090 [Neolecta irregularis DAH-3]|eukprot:OLL24060.1 hypothetical protein NEOLI_002090 [Neolecta irregularis DAH-3]